MVIISIIGLLVNIANVVFLYLQYRTLLQMQKAKLIAKEIYDREGWL
jgi:hypothetical protein